MRWTITIASVLACVVGISTASAQIQDAGEIRADVHVTMGIPQGELGDRIDNNAFGLAALIGGRVPGLPLILGTEVGFMNYGTDSQLSIHSTVLDGGIDPDLAFPVEAMSVGVANNVLLGHFVVRLQPTEGVIQPYVDALAGVKSFMTRVNVDSDVIAFGRGLSQDSRSTDIALSYGVGGGIELALYEYQSGWKADPSTISLHAGVRYLFGSNAQYVGDGSFSEIDGRFVLGTVESRTDLLVPHFGIRVRQ